MYTYDARIDSRKRVYNLQRLPLDTGEQPTLQKNVTASTVEAQAKEDYSTQLMKPIAPQKLMPSSMLRATIANKKVVLASGMVLSLLLLFFGSYLFYDGTDAAWINKFPLQPSGTRSSINGIPSQPTAILTPTSSIKSIGITSLKTPTKVVAHPTATAKSQQTPTSKATATPTSLYGNPWGYNLKAPGYLIYTPPTSFCNYFKCISTFYKTKRGYIVECFDGMYTWQGGIIGACVHHSGVRQPLYRH